jgi:cytochrome b
MTFLTKEAATQWVEKTKERPLPILFNGCCFLSVVVPLVVFGVARSREYGYYYEHKHESEYSLGALVFVYIWTILFFAVVVYFGNQHMLSGSEDSHVFRVLLLSWANMSLVASILSATNLRALDGKNWDGRVFSLFPSCMVVTYALWAAIGIMFSLGIFYKKYKSLKEEKQRPEETEGAYQRQPDEEEPSSSVPPPPSGGSFS